MTGLSQPDGSTHPGMPVVGPIFFVTFIMSGTMIFLNLLVGVIVNSMSEMPDSGARDDAPRVQSPLPSLHAPGVDAPHAPLVAERLARVEAALEAATREIAALRGGEAGAKARNSR
jgi:hypothetical protein